MMRKMMSPTKVLLKMKVLQNEKMMTVAEAQIPVKRLVHPPLNRRISLKCSIDIFSLASLLDLR